MVRNGPLLLYSFAIMKSFTDNIKSILSLIVVLMTYVIFLIVLFRYPTDNNAVSQVIIAVVGGFGAISGYYFGYSAGASKKDEQMANIAAQPTVNNADTVNVKQ